MAIRTKRQDGTVYEMFVGAVLADRERNYHDDSDFYAVVWDDTLQQVTTIEYASTRYGGGGTCTVDASEDVLEKARRWLAERRFADWKRWNAEQAREPKLLKTVRVTKGKNEGKEGDVFWRGANPFRTYYRNGFVKPEYNQRVGLKTALGEKVWADLEAVEVVDPEEWLLPIEEGERLRDHVAESATDFYQPFVMPGMVAM